MSMLLMLAMLGLFIPSSQAVTCYSCTSLIHEECEHPSSSTDTCTGDVCVRAQYRDEDGLLTQYTLSFENDTLSVIDIALSTISYLLGWGDCL